jgi:hypothetical protein
MDEFNVVDNLILNGGLEFAGSDPETGEALYKPTERLKDIDSKLSNEISIYFSDVTLKLWEKGFIEMNVMESDPIVSLSPKALNQNFVKTLEKDERLILQEIVKVLSNKK